MADLAAALQLLYDLEDSANAAGGVTLLNESVDLLTTVLDETSEGEARSRHSANLANALRLRYEVCGGIDDLDSGTYWARLAIPDGPITPIAAQRYSNLSLLLKHRFERFGAFADIDEAVTCLEVVLNTELGSHQRRLIQSNLGICLMLRGASKNDVGDLTRSFRIAESVLAEEGSDGLHFSDHLTNAGLAAVELYRLTAERYLIERAVVMLEEAAKSCKWPESTARRLLNLSIARRLLFAVSADAEDLDRSIAACEAASHHFDAEQPDVAGLAAARGRAYWARYQLTGTVSDAEVAISSRQSVARDERATLRDRLDSARAVGDWSMSRGDPAAAAAGYAVAIDLLPLLGWMALDRVSQEHEASRLTGLACDAAAAHLALGDPGPALAEVERGRAILWRQTLDLWSPARTDTHPELEKLRQELIACARYRDAAVLPDYDHPRARGTI